MLDKTSTQKCPAHSLYQPKRTNGEMSPARVGRLETAFVAIIAVIGWLSWRLAVLLVS